MNVRAVLRVHMVSAIVCLLLLPAQRTFAQELLPDSVLEHVDSVHAAVLLDWDTRITNVDEGTVDTRLNTALQLGLRRYGILVVDTSWSSLLVVINVMYDNGVVIYSWNTQMYEYGLTFHEAEDAAMRGLDHDSLTTKSPKPDPIPTLIELLHSRHPIIVWTGTSGVGSVGEDYLSGTLEKTVSNVAQSFANKWLAYHRQKKL